MAVLSDSTNAIIDGFSKSELYVYDQLDRFFDLYRSKRMIIVTFASNMDRVQQIINLCRKYGKKIAIDGSLVKNVFSISRMLGYIDVDDDILTEVSDISNYKDDEIVILTTGNHGESVQCISGIAEGNHVDVKIKENDVVLFSSVAIFLLSVMEIFWRLAMKDAG